MVLLLPRTVTDIPYSVQPGKDDRETPAWSPGWKVWGTTAGDSLGAGEKIFQEYFPPCSYQETWGLWSKSLWFSFPGVLHIQTRPHSCSNPLLILARWLWSQWPGAARTASSTSGINLCFGPCCWQPAQLITWVLVSWCLKNLKPLCCWQEMRGAQAWRGRGNVLRSHSFTGSFWGCYLFAKMRHLFSWHIYLEHLFSPIKDLLSSAQGTRPSVSGWK